MQLLGILLGLALPFRDWRKFAIDPVQTVCLLVGLLRDRAASGYIRRPDLGAADSGAAIDVRVPAGRADLPAAAGAGYASGVARTGATTPRDTLGGGGVSATVRKQLVCFICVYLRPISFL
jgi:hypothetical protein